MKAYPSFRYHPTQGAKIIHSEEADIALGPEWVHSPAEFGHETCPSAEADQEILAKGDAYRKRFSAESVAAPRKPGKPKKLDPKEGVSA